MVATGRRSWTRAPSSSVIVIEPPSSPVTSVCTIDRPRPFDSSIENVVRQADAVVDDLDPQLAVEPVQPHHHLPAGADVVRSVADRERVIHRVLHQLVQHHRERRGHLTGELARVALDHEAHSRVG